jgi:hypothetical protein
MQIIQRPFFPACLGISFDNSFRINELQMTTPIRTSYKELCSPVGEIGENAGENAEKHVRSFLDQRLFVKERYIP